MPREGRMRGGGGGGGLHALGPSHALERCMLWEGCMAWERCRRGGGVHGAWRTARSALHREGPRVGRMHKAWLHLTRLARSAISQLPPVGRGWVGGGRHDRQPLCIFFQSFLPQKRACTSCSRPPYPPVGEPRVRCAGAPLGHEGVEEDPGAALPACRGPAHPTTTTKPHTHTHRVSCWKKELKGTARPPT